MTNKQQASGLPLMAFYEKEARGKLVEGDLFTFPVPVITVMTKGRPYGALSQRVSRDGVIIPELVLTQAKYQAPYMFVALWTDESAYTPEMLFDCGANCMLQAGAQGLEQISFPILGGKGGEKFLWAVEKGVFEAVDVLDAAGKPVPKHIYVTDKNIK
jgi:hypothetical protein